MSRIPLELAQDILVALGMAPSRQASARNLIDQRAIQGVLETWGVVVGDSPTHQHLRWLISLMRYPVAYRLGAIDYRRLVYHNPFDPDLEIDEHEDYANGWWGEGDEKYEPREQA